MEKLVYVLWRPEGSGPAAFREALLGALGPELLEHGVSKLQVLVADEHVAGTERARLARLDPPLAGSVSLWLDSLDERGPVERALARHASRFAGYLVTESVPRPNRTRRAPPGERTPGVVMLSCIEKPDRMELEEWLAFWQGHHTPVANEVQCTFSYVRNAVARVLTPNAPPWRGIVEEGFPTEAVTDPMLWYRAEGSPERLRENLGRMVASVRAFLDVDRVESHPMSEYVLRA